MKTRFLLVFALVGCGGGSDLDPGSGDDPGNGTLTLFVDANVEVSPRLSNAQQPSDFETDFEVEIRLTNQDGQHVTTGTVTIEGRNGVFALVYDGGNNRWQGTAPQYDEVYILDVISGEHEIIGVRVDGPDLHHFTKPLPGANVDSTLPLEVAWSSDNEADTSAIRADQIDWVAIPDNGKYTLAPGALHADKDQARTNDLQLVRTDRVIPAGALAGSEFSIRVENHIEVVALPNPAL